jgi:aryl-alcohol dehydrogenase-like predicted oxidoreductase
MPPIGGGRSGGDVQQRSIGDVQVSAIGLGAMPLSVDPAPDAARAEATVHAALDAGVTLIDTADAYTPSTAGHLPGHNEQVVARALASYGGDTGAVLVATKGGHTRAPDGGWHEDGRPEHLRRACEASLKALGVDVIGLYQHHRPDPDVPYDETMGGLKALLDDGLVQRAGISNADTDQIRTAHRILGRGLVSVQNELSPTFRSSRAEVAVCEELGLAFLPWSPLGGAGDVARLGERHPAFAEVADRHGATPQQVALAWLLAMSDRVIPIPGASRPESIRSSVEALDLVLSDADRRALDDD